MSRSCGPVRPPQDGLRQKLQILLARDLDTAEALQVRGRELRVEQAETAFAEPLDQGDETHLRRVSAARLGPAEHALAEERRADVHAVEAADQRAVAPRFDAVREAVREELDVRGDQPRRQPGLAPLGPGLGTALDHALE